MKLTLALGGDKFNTFESISILNNQQLFLIKLADNVHELWMEESLTITEEQDDVFGPVLSRAEFQGSIQRHPGLSIPVRWLLLQFV